MTNAELAAVFDQIADLLEFRDENPFRVRAYRNAARTIRDLPEAAAQIAADPQRKLSDLEGIGKDLAGKMATLLGGGSLAMLDELLKEVPESVLTLMRIPGLGPKRVAALHKQLHVNTLRTRSATCTASGRRPRRRSSRGWTSPRRPKSGCCGPRPTSPSRKSWPTCAIARPSSRSPRPGVTGGAARRWATWTCWR
jgi:DNA polymerase/3'-5' exonuclease PolX